MKNSFLGFILCLSATLCMACSDDASVGGNDQGGNDEKPGSEKPGTNEGEQPTTCASDDECHGEYTCFQSACVIAAHIDEACGSGDRVCVVGECVANTCVMPEREPVVGDACTKHDDCGESLVCVEQACSERLVTGSRCRDDAACVSGLCHERVCSEYKELDEPCGTGAVCKDDLWCGKNGVCQPLPQPGEVCDAKVGCAGGADCIGEMCYMEDLTDGAECNMYYHCAPGWYCHDHLERCVIYGHKGDACSDYHLCDSNTVCLNGVCTTNRGECEVDDDCMTDSYCCNDERCDVKNVCISYGEGPRGTTDYACEYQTVSGMFEAAIQCEWTKPEKGDPYPNHVHVLTTPLVINTPHDSGQANEIVFVTYNYTDGGSQSSSGSDIRYNGVIRIINAETCKLHENLFDDNNHIIGGSNPAAADVDGDGYVEIFASRGSAQNEGSGGGIVAWHWKEAEPPSDEHPEGIPAHYAFWWKTDVASSSTIYWGGSAIHDINNDDVPEIIGYGGEVFDATTGKRLNKGQTISELSYTATLGDFDNDGKIEIIGISNVWEWDSTNSKWVLEYSNIHSGVGLHHAFADFGTTNEDGSFDFEHLDGIAEIVSCGNKNVNVSTLKGKTVFKQTVSDNGGGPCTVGDFDGDGFPEVATAFGDYYRIFDPRCEAPSTDCKEKGILWAQKSQDHSSYSTGSSLFDFDGDGAMEAVYADECYTRVYDGKTGDVLFSSYHTSLTWHEYPVIADVDNDESAEIVVGSNNTRSCQSPDPIHRGLRCVKDADCRSRSCVDGLCRCTDDKQCNYRTDANGEILDEYACVAGITTADQAGGKVCRAKHVASESMTGVRVMRDSLDRWTSSRNLWNQHAYSITNILDDMTIPKTENWVQNFLSKTPFLNNFRQNVQGARGRNAAPDITGRFTGDSCSISGDTISLGAEICNRGEKMVASLMPATFYLIGDDESRTKLCTSYTSENVPVGGCLHVSCTIDDPNLVMYKPIVMVANDDGNGGRTTVECNENNNEDYTVVRACPIY